MSQVRDTVTTPPAAVMNSAWTGRAISFVMVLASMSVVTARLADAPVLSSANDRSRWCTVWALVERGTYQIDEIHNRPGWSTIDQVKHEGHFYSSKPPLLPRLVAEVYRSLKFLTGWTLTEQTALVTHTILFLINVIPMGLALLVFSSLIARQTSNLWAQIFMMACACWGMMLLPFLTVFNNHTIAASCFFIVLPLAARILIDEQTAGWRYVVCGVLAAFGVCNELPAALFGLSLFFLLFAHRARPTLTLFLPGALVVLAAFFITNYQATGSLKPFYARYGTETYEFIHEGVPSYWKEPKGIDRPRDSTAMYLLHCTFGHHGIYSLSPIFLLALAGWASPGLWWKSRWKSFHLLGLGLTVVTLGFYLTKTENYNYGGMSVALRWMMWLTPFWLLTMTPVISRMCGRRWFRAVSLVLLSVSIFSAWYPSKTPWTQNWIYQLMSGAKWIDYSDPAPAFTQTHYTWLGTLPEGPLQADYAITFQTFTASGQVETIQLRDGGPVSDGERLIQVERSVAGGASPIRIGYRLNGDRFRAGSSVEEFLTRREDGRPLTDTDLEFFRGMPRRMQYIASRIRYEKTSLRTDAFRCHIGYTYVTIEDPRESQRKLRIVRNVWYSEEVPFGVLQWEEHVEDASDRKQISRQVWRASTAGKFLKRLGQSPF